MIMVGVMTSNSGSGVKNLIPKDKSLICYDGDFNSQTIDIIMREIRNKLQNSLHRRTFKSLYSITVECIENIVRHGVSYPNKSAIPGYFILSETEKDVSFIVANRIGTEDKIVLENRFNFLTHSDLDDIKKRYKNDLMFGEISDKGGAGLGMYVMAMKSNKNFKFDFTPCTSGSCSTFALYVNIQKQPS